MEELRDYVGALLAEYQEQVDRYRSCLEEIGDGNWHEAPAPGEWAPHQIVAHVVSAETLAFQIRLQRIMAEERPNLPNWDAERWMNTEYDKHDPMEAMLARWERARSEVLPPMQELPLTEWNRLGIHESWGEKTLLWWLEYSVQHAHEHLEQLTAVTTA